LFKIAGLESRRLAQVANQNSLSLLLSWMDRCCYLNIEAKFFVHLVNQSLLV